MYKLLWDQAGVRFPKASLANYGDKSHWTLLVMTELASIVVFGKRTPGGAVVYRPTSGTNRTIRGKPELHEHYQSEPFFSFNKSENN